MASPFEEPGTMAVMVLLLILLAIAVFFEVRFIRSRKSKGVDKVLIKDEAFNAVVCTKALANTLRQRGERSKEADLLLVDAEAAYSRGDYLPAKASADRAKEALRHAKKDEASAVFDEAVIPKADEEDAQAAVCEVPFAETKKLPKDLLESKFVISSVQDSLDQAKSPGKDTSVAEDHLAQAKDLLKRCQYTDALRFAMKAKRSLEGGDTKDKAKAEEPAAEDRLEPADKPKTDYCRNCNTLVDEGDTFCRRCGEKMIKVPHCPGCSVEVGSEDVFCRKCGTQLRSLFSCPICQTEVGETDERCPKCHTPLG